MEQPPEIMYRNGAFELRNGTAAKSTSTMADR